MTYHGKLVEVKSDIFLKVIQLSYI